jgi:type I restriction enzyme S subunit
MERERKTDTRGWFDASDGEYRLPDGWRWSQLGEIAEIVGGNSPAGSSYNREQRGVPLINGPTEFGPGPLDNPKAVQYTEAPSRFCEAGDLLVCVRGSTGRTNVASFRAAIGRGLAAVRAPECQLYVNHYVAAQADQLSSIGTGTTFSSISVDQLRALMVPLPPLSEQLRIVKVLGRSLAEIDLGVQSLERARIDLVRLRAAVLRSAVTGELTSSATGAVPGAPVESGSDLLRRILAAQRSPTSLGPQGALFQGPRERGPLPDFIPSDQLPSGWAWATFGQLCEIQLGRAKSPSNRSNRYPTKYLRAANITDEGLDLSDLLEMEFAPHERDVFRLRAGDLVVAEASGSADKVGKPAVWNDELPLCCFQNTVIRLRPCLLDSSYVLLLLRHCYFNGVFANLSDGMGINHLGAGRLARVVVPLPPEVEQRVMVQEVERQLISIEASRQAINSKLSSAGDLRAAVLSQAFRGELVRPEPADESAEALVKRISARRARDMAARPPKAETRGIPRMKASLTHKLLLEVLKEHPDGMTPEALLATSNYTRKEVDRFYSELSRIADQVLQEKPQGAAAEKWPRGAHVLLRLKGV